MEEKKEEKIVVTKEKQSKPKEGIHTGHFSNHGQEYTHDFIVQESKTIEKKSKEEIKKDD